MTDGVGFVVDRTDHVDLSRSIVDGEHVTVRSPRTGAESVQHLSVQSDVVVVRDDTRDRRHVTLVLLHLDFVRMKLEDWKIVIGVHDYDRHVQGAIPGWSPSVEGDHLDPVEVPGLAVERTGEDQSNLGRSVQLPDDLQLHLIVGRIVEFDDVLLDRLGPGVDVPGRRYDERRPDRHGLHQLLDDLAGNEVRPVVVDVQDLDGDLDDLEILYGLNG